MELRAEHVAHGHRVAVEPHPDGHVQDAKDYLDRVEQRPDGRRVVRGVGHGRPNVEDVGALRGHGAVQAGQRHLTAHDQRGQQPDDERHVADRGVQAEETAEQWPAPTHPGPVAAYARRERVRAQLQTAAQPDRVNQQRVALEQAHERVDHEHGQEREPLKIVGVEVQAGHLRDLHDQRHRQQHGHRGAVRVAAAGPQQLVQPDRFEQVHVHRGGLRVVVEFRTVVPVTKEERHTTVQRLIANASTRSILHEQSLFSKRVFKRAVDEHTTVPANFFSTKRTSRGLHCIARIDSKSVSRS